MNEEGCVCGRCTKFCPWNRPDMEPRDYNQWDGDLGWLYESVNDQRRRNIANDFVDPRERTHKWWYRSDEVEDGLIVPTTKNSYRFCQEYPVQE